MPHKNLRIFIIIIFFLSQFIAVDHIRSQNWNEVIPKEEESDEQNTFELDKPNSHKEIECTTCHAVKPEPNTNRLDIQLISGVDNSVDLCNQCHSDFNLHPVNVDPDIVAPDMLIPRVFPLGLKGETEGKIICITCHDVHLDGALNVLLRGLPGKTDKGGKFESRIAMCHACHGNKLAEKNPHTQSARTCRYCHLSDPTRTKESEVTFRNDLLKLCEFCHDSVADEHFDHANPFSDKKLQFLIPDLKLPMLKGKVTCLTCHDPHSDPDVVHFLREKYVHFAEKSQVVNPHDTGMFCLSCHPLDPRTTPKVTYKSEGNFIKLCNWCHATGEATFDIHPVNVKPDRVKVNEKYFPLQDGKVGCITCHDHRCELEDINDDVLELNPRFLRGGPYTNRSEICYRCHPKSSRFDVHDQINDEGEKVDKTCHYCHVSTPDETDSEDDGLIDKPLYTTRMTHLCTRCHQDSPHPASFLHIVKPSEEIRQNIIIYQIENNVKIPLDQAGMITCVSCHNPHERGIIKNVAGAYGADEESRKRMKFICLACHAGVTGNEFGKQ